MEATTHYSIIKLFNAIHPLSEVSKNFLKSKIKVERYKKKVVLTQMGAVTRQLYFIRKGMIKSYTLNNNNKNVLWVTYDNEPAVAISSFFYQLPSQEILECVEDTIVESIDYETLQYMIENFPDINKIYHHFILDFFVKTDAKIRLLKIPNSRERFEEFIRLNQHHYKDYIKRIPKHILASVLNMRPETLSRIITETGNNLI